MPVWSHSPLPDHTVIPGSWPSCPMATGTAGAGRFHRCAAQAQLWSGPGGAAHGGGRVDLGCVSRALPMWDGAKSEESRGQAEPKESENSKCKPAGTRCLRRCTHQGRR